MTIAEFVGIICVSATLSCTFVEHHTHDLRDLTHEDIGVIAKILRFKVLNPIKPAKIIRKYKVIK
jgi:hypothetical protein